ncbi:FecR family protein [Deminuibacter soli]|uniref:FecR family protein n=1 Tax=Deminuibacter soli TaxID=2291815 RepID=UPI0013144F92|nr:FecR family protein [Deminuibacter soli]
MPQEISAQRVKKMLEQYAPDFVAEQDIAELLHTESPDVLQECMDLLEPGADATLFIPAISRFRSDALWLTLDPAVPRKDIPARRPRTMALLRMAAVLGGTVLLTAAVWRALYPSFKRQLLTAKGAAAVTKGVVPGTNKATLLLSDGSAVLLSDAGTGMVAQQGNVQILQHTRGSISCITTVGKPQAGYNTLVTPRGGQYNIILPDGTAVWLNAGSSLRYPVQFTGNERRVYVTGEAYFEVAPDKNRPFRVHVQSAAATGKTEVIEVLGTRFNVKAYNDHIKTTLLDGAIKITGDNNTVLLRPGQSLTQTAGNNAAPVKQADTEEAIAWKNGYFLFKHTPVKNVMEQVAAWYNVNVNYTGAADFECNARAINRSVPLTELLHLLELTGKVRFKVQDHSVTVIAL